MDRVVKTGFVSEKEFQTCQKVDWLGLADSLLKVMLDLLATA